MEAMKDTHILSDIKKRLLDGQHAVELIKAGYAKSSVYYAASKLKSKESDTTKHLLKNTISNSGTQKVGEITIECKDWSFNQHQAFLILDTYERIRQEYNYTGSISDFIYFCVETVRLINQ